MLVAAVQLCSGPDRERNLATAAHLTAEAAGRGARLVVLPEMVNVLGTGQQLRDGAEPADGPTASWAADQARHHGVWLVAGSFIEQRHDGTRRNTSLLVAPWGEVVASYQKVHLFDCDVPGAEFHESAVTSPGDAPVVADTGDLGLRVGMTICYDLRFPYLYRDLAHAGATMLSIPSSFTVPTGQAHWHALMRARAIETGCFVFAPAQVGTHKGSNRKTYGHSVAVAPWGEVLADAGGETAGFVVADIDLGKVAEARKMVPSLTHDRKYSTPVLHKPGLARAAE